MTPNRPIPYRVTRPLAEVFAPILSTAVDHSPADLVEEYLSNLVRENEAEILARISPEAIEAEYTRRFR